MCVCVRAQCFRGGWGREEIGNGGLIASMASKCINHDPVIILSIVIQFLTAIVSSWRPVGCVCVLV